MALKLYREDGEAIPAYQYIDDASPPSLYTETDDPIDWDTAHQSILGSVSLPYYSSIRDKINSAYQALGAPTSAQKEIASKWFVIDKSVRDTTSRNQQDDSIWLGERLHLNREGVDLEACSSKMINADKPDIDVIVLGHGELWYERLTTVQRLALSPLAGFKVWDTDLGEEYAWNGSVWERTSAKSYIHNQGSASASWSVVHNLGKYPSVTVVDSGNTEVIGDVNHTDVNNLTVTFSAAFAGKAYIN